MVTAEQLDSVRAALAGVEMSSADEVLTTFSKDESGLSPMAPQLVVFPRDTAEVQAVLRACVASRVPVTPVGARTGKSGGSLCARGGVALSLERMNRIIGVYPEELVAVAQPGVLLGALHEAVEAQGLFYPPDPNSSAMCTLGGTVAENAGGPRAVKYGVTRDYVLGLEWVLPNGAVVRPGRRTHKGVAGYDLVGLFVGSEGTLGVATEVTVKLLPKPRAVVTALAPFASLDAAARAASGVFSAGFLPRCLELLDDVALAAVRAAGYPFPGDAQACLLVEVDGWREEAALAELEALAAELTRHGAGDVQVAQGDEQRERLWKSRRLVSPALRGLARHKLSEDVVVPRSKLALAIARFRAEGEARGVRVATYGHAGDGNLHVNVLWDDDAQAEAVEQTLRSVMEISVALHGSITGEHGVGLAKRRFLGLEHDESTINAYRVIKECFDKDAFLNPEKIF